MKETVCESKNTRTPAPSNFALIKGHVCSATYHETRMAAITKLALNQLWGGGGSFGEDRSGQLDGTCIAQVTSFDYDATGHLECIDGSV